MKSSNFPLECSDLPPGLPKPREGSRFSLAHKVLFHFFVKRGPDYLFIQEEIMPQGSKESYSPKQKRMASHIEEGYKSRGDSSKKAERIAWATVNKKDHGAKGRKKKSRILKRKSQ